MNRLISAAALAALLCCAPRAAADSPALQIYHPESALYIPLKWDSISSVTISVNDSVKSMAIMMKDGTSSVRDMDAHLFSNGVPVPHISITTDEDLEEIPDKENYKTALFEMEGFGRHENVEKRVSIRGRGNTSWLLFDKKPYRLKFDKKTALCGLKNAKNYVLLAGATDLSLMQNAVAAKIARMLGMPYVCDMVPVDVTLNRRYRGSYLLANKPGINSGCVDIDEDTSVMWELDTYMDEEHSFRSPVYNMPVMLADPDMKESRFLEWKEDYIRMEESVAAGDAASVIDTDLYAAYRCVYEIMVNNEIGAPKSLKMYKTEGGKYCFGPIWDFDCAMGYDWDSGESYISGRESDWLWLNDLMKAIDNCPGVAEAVRKTMHLFLSREDELMDFIDSHIAYAHTSAMRNYSLWEGHGDWREHSRTMKNWLKRRIDVLRERYGYPE